MKGGSLQPNEKYRFFFDGLMHHYYMERLIFCASIKYIFETNLQKYKISCAKDFISVILSSNDEKNRT